jgi:hypothetical protein
MGLIASVRVVLPVSLRRSKAALLATGLICLGSGCESEAAKRCRAEYLGTHAMVPTIDVDDFASVEQGLLAVQNTRKSCEAAGLREELEQLDKVATQLESHRDHLHTHGKPKDVSPAELEKLVAEGDPGCPKGQAYKPKNATKEVRCTGPKLADMTWSQAKDFFEGRGFKMSEAGNVLTAEYGSESYRYRYASANADTPPICIEVFAPPGISWQESVARLTGAPPHRLAEGKPVKTTRGELSLTHTKDDVQAIYQLGNCR